MKEKIVAPLVGAWIETIKMYTVSMHFLSHPSWVRGLKQIQHEDQMKTLASHPSWVRGLKRRISHG